MLQSPVTPIGKVDPKLKRELTRLDNRIGFFIDLGDYQEALRLFLEKEKLVEAL